MEDGAVGTGSAHLAAAITYNIIGDLMLPTAGGHDVSVRVISDSPGVAAYARVILAASAPRSERPVVTAYVLTSMTGRFDRTFIFNIP